MFESIVGGVLERAGEYGFTVLAMTTTIIALGWVVRSLWRDAKADEADRRAAINAGWEARLADKNAELAQVWSQLRESRDEVRIIRAEKEWLERMNDRGDDMVVKLLEWAMQRSIRR